MNVHISISIEANEVPLVQMNKDQMLRSKDSNNMPLIHRMTGVATLSPAYARLKNKLTPNLKDAGSFQKWMFMEVDENSMTYFLDSEDYKSRFLVDNYGQDIFGIPLKDVPQAKKLNFKSFSSRFKLIVFKR